jgi:glucosamine-6-phosphate deaminase
LPFIDFSEIDFNGRSNRQPTQSVRVKWKKKLHGRAKFSNEAADYATPNSGGLLPSAPLLGFSHEQWAFSTAGGQPDFYPAITMEVVIRPTAESSADLAALIIAQELRINPRLVLGLATGKTMNAVYARLVKIHADEGLDFSNCRTFNLDEYVGLPPDHANSYRHYMNQHLFLRVNIDLRNTHVPDGRAMDLAAECSSYEQAIAEAGGIDLQLLGIGQNGHLGFNEPLSAFRSRTSVKFLSPATRAQNASLFPRADLVPRRAITMGVGTILDCRRCVLLATGEGKAAIVARAVEGPMTSMIAATALAFTSGLHNRSGRSGGQPAQGIEFLSTSL